MQHCPHCPCCLEHELQLQVTSGRNKGKSETLVEKKHSIGVFMGFPACPSFCCCFVWAAGSVSWSDLMLVGTPEEAVTGAPEAVVMLVLVFGLPLQAREMMSSDCIASWSMVWVIPVRISRASGKSKTILRFLKDFWKYAQLRSDRQMLIYTVIIHAFYGIIRIYIIGFISIRHETCRYISLGPVARATLGVFTLPGLGDGRSSVLSVTWLLGGST